MVGLPLSGPVPCGKTRKRKSPTRSAMIGAMDKTSERVGVFVQCSPVSMEAQWS